MTQNNITDIEKCARLMGYNIAMRKTDFNYYHLDADSTGTFDPRTNKADLSDVIDEFGIDVSWNEAGEYVHAVKRTMHLEYVADKYEYFSSHNNNKFAARAEAVIAVAVQIYDAKYGKDGE